MKTLEGYLHYRMIDVSSIINWLFAGSANCFWHGETNQHTALADIRESIEELRYYRTHYLLKKTLADPAPMMCSSTMELTRPSPVFSARSTFAS